MLDNLHHVDIRQIAEHNEEEEKLKIATAAQEALDDDALHAIIFTVQRKQTFQVIKTLHRVTYGNLYYETYQIEHKLGADDETGDKDLISVYVPGSDA